MAESDNPPGPERPAGAGIDENATLGELLRQAPKRADGKPPVPLPPGLADLTAKQAREKFETVTRAATTVFVSWLVFHLVGGAASAFLDDLVLHHARGISGAELWKAQAVLLAPYLVIASLGAMVLRRKVSGARPEAWARALSAVYAVTRFVSFVWCGPPAPPGDAVLARLADAAAVFAVTRLAFGRASAARPADADADRFGPGPIEP